MLLNKREIISEYKINNGIDESDCNIECFIKNEGKYNIYLFVVEIFKEEKLEDIYNVITNNIAFEFQTELDKLIEKWNIYLIAIASFEVKTDIKYKIAQNTFAVRKIVYDNFDKNKNEIEEYINSKLFNIDEKLSRLEKEKRKKTNDIDSLQGYIDYKNKQYSLASKEDNSEIIYKKFIGEEYE